MVLLQGVQGLVQGFGQALDALLVLVGEVEEVEIVGAPAVGVGIDLVLNAVQTGHEDGGIGVVGIAGGVGVAQLKALLSRGLGVGGDADDGGAVGGGVADGHRGLEPGHQALEGVGGGVRNRADGGGVLEERLKCMTKRYLLENEVTFHGFATPQRVRKYMEEAGLRTYDRRKTIKNSVSEFIRISYREFDGFYYG